LPRQRAVLCVVAEDKPGLLSFISASLVSAQLDVMAAQAFTRDTHDGGREAVDFAWVRRRDELDAPVRSTDAAHVAEVLTSLLAGSLSLEAVTARVAQPVIVLAAGGSTRVAFEGPAGAKSVLSIETLDRPGLLLAITLALFRARAQIVASEANTEVGRAYDRFTVAELDGTPLTPQRRIAVQTAVKAAIEGLDGRG
jgi:[protein-PII] uridylyltransferase